MPDVGTDISEEWGYPSLSGGVFVHGYGLDEEIDFGAVCLAKIQEDRVGTCCERVELVVEARAEEAFGGVEARCGVVDAFCKIMHVARPVIEVLANSATSAGGSGARGGCNVGSKGKIVGGPAIYCLASEAAIFIPLL